MALKGDRQEITHDISFFDNDTTAERGGIVSLSTAGSGAALDQAAAVVTYAALPSGKVPVGMLLNDIVNVNQARYHINYQKNEMNTGGKAVLMTEGWAVTNMIAPGATPTAGKQAVLAQSGLITTAGGVYAQSDDNTGLNRVGRWMSVKDEDGYAKLYVKLPNSSNG